MQGFWEDDEVKALFYEVERCKKENRAIKEAFASHAQKFARKENSVRNYYYNEIDNLSKDGARTARLGLNLDKHQKTSITFFSQEEEKGLLSQIDELINKGLSVRRACFVLADGDAVKLLRYQNKYRNHIAKKKLDQCDLPMTNVITFQKPQSKGLTDAEVQSLFMGLVRLVKRNAAVEGEERAKEKINAANKKLKETLLALQAQSQEIERMKQRYSQLKRQNNDLARRLLHAGCDKTGRLREKLSQKNGFEEDQREKI